MFVWIIGDGGGLLNLIADEMKLHQCTVLISSDRESPPSVEVDFCLDASATGVGDVKKVIGKLDFRTTHYVLLSSCLVYPSVPRRIPWREDDIDLNDAVGFTTLWASRRRLRASERELNYTGHRGVPWTILRPSVVESISQPDPNSIWWMVSRILDGGPIVLPDNDEPLFALVSDSDLAKAVWIVAGKEKSYFQTINVTSPTFVSYDSYARRIMAALGKEVPIVRVPADLWYKAGLHLPLERYIHSSFVEESSLLATLGWEPTDEVNWLREHVKSLIDNPLAKPRQRRAELDLTKVLLEERPIPERQDEARSWCLTAQAGNPTSIKIGRTLKPVAGSDPLLRVLYYSPGLAEELLLISPTRSDIPIVLGHNALLEMVSPGGSGLGPDRQFLPVARRPCGTAGCPICMGTEPGVSGITDDGYGVQYVRVPAQHLVPVSTDLNVLSLLADPLACLVSVVPPFLDHLDGTVWVFGERVEALLAILLVKSAGHTVLHVSRNEVRPEDLPHGVQGKNIARVRVEIRDDSIDKAGMLINCSGARDGENLLISGLSHGGIRITPFDPTMPHQRRIDINYPIAAPGRFWLEKAIDLLGNWKDCPELNRYIAPVPLNRPSDLFVTEPFRMRYLDAKGGMQ